MKCITIRLPGGLIAKLARESDRREMPMSEIARDAIALHLARLGNERIVDGRRMLPFAGIGRSGRTDFAQRIDEILAEERPIDNDRRG